jgi:neutral trehalase
MRAFAGLCELGGLRQRAIELKARAEELAGQIDDLLWNERLGMYCNRDTTSGAAVELRSWTGLAPVLFDAAKAERIEEVIKGNILSETQFLRPAGLSSVAASEPLYNQAKRGLYGRAIVSNWQGPMWILPNALAVRCLVRHGFKREARTIAHRVLATIYGGLASAGTLFENYNAETGEPLWAPHFMSWNIMALELIELLEDF